MSKLTGFLAEFDRLLAWRNWNARETVFGPDQTRAHGCADCGLRGAAGFRSVITDVGTPRVMCADCYAERARHGWEFDPLPLVELRRKSA